jgi:hypothetical protein
MKKLFAMCMLLISMAAKNAYAQPCTALTVTGTSVTPASCPGSGSITVSASGTGVSYQLISGPAGYSTASNTTGTFNTLTAGAYIVEVKDACNVKTTVSKTVSNTYPAFSISSSSASNVCTANVTGGTLNAAVTGGKAPYTYDAVPVGSTPVYGGSTSSTSFVKNVTGFGVYRFFVKDACGEVRTSDIAIVASQPIPADIWWEDILVNRPCAETMDGLQTVTWTFHFLAADNQAVNMNDIIGSTYSIYKSSPANSITYSATSGNCPLGALLTSGSILYSNIDQNEPNGYPVTIPQEDVILVLTNKCGQTFRYCMNFNNGDPVTPNATIDLIQNDCAAQWANQNTAVLVRDIFFMSPPYNFLLTKNGGATEANSTGNFWSLMPADYPANVKITDACGRVVNKMLTMPLQGSALSAIVDPEWGLSCTNVKGAATAFIHIASGDLQGLANATNVTITGGTPAAIPGIGDFQYWLPGYVANNLLAGYAYKIHITNLCGEKDSIAFTVPADQWGQATLNWNLTATADALCGQNKSSITAVANYTGFKTLNYSLYNLTAPSTALATNTSGYFPDINPGNYKVKFVVDPNWACPDRELKDSINVTVLNDATGQSITRRTITTCEVNGTPTSSGKAIVDVNGSAPFIYEIIKTNLVGTGATEVWELSSTNNFDNTYTWDIPLAGDPSNTQYTLRSTDKCGNKVTTQASLQPLNNPTLVSQNNPCINNMNYTLTIVPYAGAFTYRWVKLPDLATTLSTQNTLVFPGAYTADKNGTYRCFVSLAGCVDRTKDVIMNSNNCSFVLPVKLLSFEGKLKNGFADLNWIAENETNTNYYELERSTDGRNFAKLKILYTKANQLPVNDYNHTDDLTGINEKTIYYRLRSVEKDGSFTYSNVVKLMIGAKANTLVVYPLPVKNEINISFESEFTNVAFINIIDIQGKILRTEKKNVKKGSNSFKIFDLTAIPSGTYFIQIDNGPISNTKIVKF